MEGIPALSMLSGVPRKRIWTLGLVILSSSAMATAGYMWPPVPPAAKTTRRVSVASFCVVGICSFGCWCSRERQQRCLRDLKWKKTERDQLTQCICVCVCVKESKRERCRACQDLGLSGRVSEKEDGREE